MVEDEERGKQTEVKGDYKEAMKKDHEGKKIKRDDRKSRMERDEYKEKIRENEDEKILKMNENDKKAKKKSNDETGNEARRNGGSEEMGKNKRYDGGWRVKVDEEEKRNQAIQRMRKDEKIRMNELFSSREKSLEKNNSTNGADYHMSRDKIDEQIIRSLTPEMANEMKIRGIIFYEDLGKGTFSIVKKGWCNMLAKMVAIKIIDTRKDSKYTRKCLPREIELVRKLQHENIIKAYEVIEKNPYVCIIQDFTSRGDLLQKIRRESKVDEKEGKIHFRQLIEVMKYLKSMEVVHRDIKCENILLDSCENVKITDFGFARLLKKGEKSKTFCGSRAYLAPEIIRAQPYDGYLSDMWSAGIVLYVMITGMMPYNDKDVKKMLERQLQHRIAYRRTTEISIDAKRLIYDILHPIPHKRLTIEEVLRSKWLAGTEYRILVQAASDSIATNSDKPT
ncbi:Testis-specific serine/threonine-protein kinase [Dirofilaria immitis]